MELELQRSSYDLLPVRKKQMTFFNQVGVCMLGFLFYFLIGVKPREIDVFLLQHMNSFLVLIQIVLSAYYNQVRNANAELQLLSLILNVSIISVIYISSA